MNRKDFLRQSSLLAVGGSLLPFTNFGYESVGSSLGKLIEKPENEYDIAIIGGSYAGLSAALTLARCLRKVLVIDAGKPRNRFAKQAHNAFAMDGLAPSEIIKVANDQLSPYQNYISKLEDKVTKVSKYENGFTITTNNSGETKASFVVFATGAHDDLPKIKGIAEQWGINVHHCPYCHGFESKSGKTLLLSKDFQGLELLSSLQHWSENLTVAFQTEMEIPAQLQDFMKKQSIIWTTQNVEEVHSHKNGKLKEVIYADGSTEAVDHIYLKPQTTYQTQLAEKLGCEKNESKRLVTDDFMLTNKAGIYAIGDISSKSMGQIIWSANSGMLAGVHINNTMIANSIKN